MELWGSLPHSQQSIKSITCPYPCQTNPFLCPSHFWQAQLVSFLVGLSSYQHPGKLVKICAWEQIQSTGSNRKIAKEQFVQLNTQGLYRYHNARNRYFCSTSWNILYSIFNNEKCFEEFCGPYVRRHFNVQDKTKLPVQRLYSVASKLLDTRGSTRGRRGSISFAPLCTTLANHSVVKQQTSDQLVVSKETNYFDFT